MWELLSFMQAKVRRMTLDELECSPKTPSSIADSTGEHLSHISRALKELHEKGLVDCMTPSQSKNRFYQITSKGKEVLVALRKLE
jgi:DNA-binding MarR family transcriptional regulator